MNSSDQSVSFFLQDEEASNRWASQWAQQLSAPLVMTFSGEIGAGKTTLIRAMLRALGVQGAIKSPTFSLVESYVCHELTIHHFDLYRIHQEDELEYMGFREFFSPHALCCIEWPEHAGSLLPKADLHSELRLEKDGRRLIVTAFSLKGQSILAWSDALDPTIEQGDT
ncbi:MAG: tRNA (adenosine(37)-N6)-threonylcarbamoyltransferase complex ATPase subunit type 1 TsaE [Legionella sp.]|nr:MAG: tRNA (adenosine(37)-N6)-threonylcarbamoyltransferase complex ATPase subunit type 1 TsaE [Legionella sp.]PJD97778.1 MAG: tRNA (adenosine(37)-N6)-threonylcarbamoyltransferase complex ATPase subunit type 1 TsaE [Legionella sp.]